MEKQALKVFKDIDKNSLLPDYSDIFLNEYYAAYEQEQDSFDHVDNSKNQDFTNSFSSSGFSSDQLKDIVERKNSMKPSHETIGASTGGQNTAEQSLLANAVLPLSQLAGLAGER